MIKLKKSKASYKTIIGWRKSDTDDWSPPTGQLTTGITFKRKNYSVIRKKGTQDWLLIYTIDGKGRFGHSQGELITHKGDMTLLKPGTLHDYGLEPRLKHWGLLFAHFVPKTEWFKWLKWPEIASGLMHISISNSKYHKKIVECFNRMNDLNCGTLKHREIFAMNALEEALLWCDLANPNSEQTRVDERIQKSLEFIQKNFHEPITLENISKYCGLSTSRFFHLFKKQVHMTPQQYLIIQRINHAGFLLETTNRSITEITHEAGFSHPFYFSLRFKTHTGLSPRAYRKGLEKSRRGFAHV